MGTQYTTQNSDAVGSAVRFKPKKLHNRTRQTGRKLYIEPNALKMLENLNHYDQHQVSVGIDALASIPLPIDGAQHKTRPNFFRAKKSPGLAGNFIIKYSVNSEYIIISDITLNLAILGSQEPKKNERSALYEIQRRGDKAFNSDISIKNTHDLRSTWELNSPVTQINTTHAAVNGMLNDVQKATWLMGIHLDTAYNQDNFNQYTLFHNPSEEWVLDLYESVRDNLGITTQNAKQLAAILLDVQRKGKPVKWVAHSQGGIIFKQAIQHHIKHYGNTSLNLNTVSFHSGGNNQNTTNGLLAQVGIKKVNPDRNNPFDLVPNIGGRNNLSPGGIKRSLQFAGKVIFSDDSTPLNSPHTLPFLSLEAYKNFLTISGDHKAAEKVNKYMRELSN